MADYDRDRCRRAIGVPAAPADAARAATFGTIEALVVDMDEVMAGTIDDGGALTLRDSPGADSYDVLDKIACRSLLTGARVLSHAVTTFPRARPWRRSCATPPSTFSAEALQPEPRWRSTSLRRRRPYTPSVHEPSIES